MILVNKSIFSLSGFTFAKKSRKNRAGFGKAVKKICRRSCFLLESRELGTGFVEASLCTYRVSKKDSKRCLK